jgi:hypothetical protein
MRPSAESLAAAPMTPPVAPRVAAARRAAPSLLGALAVLCWAPEALAQSCAAPYTHAQWAGEMDQVSQKMANFQLSEAAAQLKAMQKSVPCLDKVAEPAQLGRFAREMSMMYFFQQEEDASVRWANLQRFAAPGLAWGDPNLPPIGPYRDMLEWADEPPMGGDPDSGLLPPKKGAIFINGDYALAAQARAEVPNLVQIFDGKGNVVQAYWQDGARFRPDILGPMGKPAQPAWFAKATYPGADSAGEDPFGLNSASAVADGGGEEDPDIEVEPPTPVAPPVAPEPPKPAEPVAVVEPTKPAEPEPVAVVEPTKPAEPVVASVEPTKPAEPEPGKTVVVVTSPAEPSTTPPPEPAQPGTGEPAPTIIVKGPESPAEPVGTAEPTKPVEPAVAANPTKPAEPPPPKDPVKLPGPSTPPPTPKGGPSVAGLAIGGGLGVAAGAMYGAAFATSRPLNNPDGSASFDDLVRARSTTNALVLGSGIAAVAAVGVGVTAVVSDDGAIFGLSRRW